MNQATPEYLTTQELAELLRIKERKVYELVSSNRIPCTRATGKLLFSRRDIDVWLNGKREGQVSGGSRPEVLLGSHDPLLDWAIRESGCGLASNFNGSLDGVERFAAGQGMAAGIHLYDAEHDDWNIAEVRRRFDGRDVVLAEFCWRERGLVLGQRLSGKVSKIEDLAGCSIVPRQASAGSQILLLTILQQHGMSAQDIEFAPVAHTETDAVTCVLDGSADATLGLRAEASRFNLEFVPLLRERFDLLVDRRSWFEPAFQIFLSYCRSNAFGERAASFRGYDISCLGTVHFNG